MGGAVGQGRGRGAGGGGEALWQLEEGVKGAGHMLAGSLPCSRVLSVESAAVAGAPAPVPLFFLAACWGACAVLGSFVESAVQCHLSNGLLNR